MASRAMVRTRRALLSGRPFTYDELSRRAGGKLSRRALGFVLRDLRSEGHQITRWRDFADGITYQLTDAMRACPETALEAAESDETLSDALRYRKRALVALRPVEGVRKRGNTHGASVNTTLRTYVCDRCRRTTTAMMPDFNDWIIAQRVDDPRRLVARCPDHITDWACRIAGYRRTKVVRRWMTDAKDRDDQRRELGAVASSLIEPTTFPMVPVRTPGTRKRVTPNL